MALRSRPDFEGITRRTPYDKNSGDGRGHVAISGGPQSEERGVNDLLRRAKGFAGACRWAAALLAAAGAALVLAPTAQAGTVPSGFQDNVVLSGLNQPTVFSFAPDGRVFVAEKSGLIKLFDGLGDTTPTTFADLRTEVHNFMDRGILGMTLDPQFPLRPYLYVLYTRDAVPGGNSPKWGQAGQSSDPCPNSTGNPDDGCLVTGRLVRLTVNGNVMSANLPLLTDWCQQYPSHSVGDLAFGPDGELYLSGGDGANYVFVDYGQTGSPTPNPCGDPPNPAGTALSAPTAEGGALRSQDARTTTDPTGLNGAVLRVDPDSAAGLTGNPFYSSTDANQRRIDAFGFRNPFRIAFRPGTDELWVGDVGWNKKEEINRIVDANDATAENFGWPCYEGPNKQPGYDGANLNLCESLYSGPSSGRVAPYYSYDHADDVVPGESCVEGSGAISALAFYQTGPFPDSYDGALFFGDYARSCIWVMLPGAGGLPDPTKIQTFDTGITPVDIEVTPQGELFYADIAEGTIRRISYPSGNSPPNAVATATPSNGAAPLTTTLSASGSSDPNGDTPLIYAWDLDEDGQFDDSTQVSVQRTYTQPGTYYPAVRVSDPGGASDTDSVQVQANNTPPSAQIDTPTVSDQWAVGDLIQFSGSATDAQQSTLPDTAFDWRIVLNHCPSSCHEHVVEEPSDTTGGHFYAPNHDYPAHLTVELTVTDAGGLTDTESVAIYPRTVQLTFNSVPTGLQLAVGSSQSTTPFTRTVIEGSQDSVGAPSPQTLGGQTYDFQSWSDGGDASHNIVAPQNRTFTATYGEVTPPAAPMITDTDPDSPADDTEPEVKGITGAGSPTEVSLYTNSDCSGVPAATGTPGLFADPGFTVTVPPDSTTEFSALASDAAGNDSACSLPRSYTEVSSFLGLFPSPVLGESGASCAGMAPTIVGTKGNDQLAGTKRADVIEGLGGRDRLIGRGGKDRLCGGAGADVLEGGRGRDVLKGGPGSDRCVGGPGTDQAPRCERSKDL